MNILICEDMKNEADKLAGLINGAGFDAFVLTFPSGQDTLAAIGSGAVVDVCFLDIVMPGMNGVELAEKLRAGGFAGEIVFLTSSNDFAHQSYRVKAFDYLLKPPTPESVKDILTRLDSSRKNADQDGITVKTQGMARRIHLRDISHIEVIGHTVYIRLKGGPVVEVYATLGEIASQLLPDHRFVQCHRSYIINMSDIGTVTENEAVMRGGARIPISRGFSPVKEDMLKWMFGGESG